VTGAKKSTTGVKTTDPKSTPEATPVNPAAK
jgi:hypothetical protein